MANKKRVALTREEYSKSIELLRSGFVVNNKKVRPNNRIAMIEILQATLGLRLGDILKMTLDSVIKDGNRYRLNIREEKTNKVRSFTVPAEVYTYIQDYAITNHIGKNEKLFNITERAVLKILKSVFEKMGLDTEKYGSHSYRKLFATQVYIESGYNIEVARVLLQHGSIDTTQRYITISMKEVEDVLALTTKNLI